jgi:hypothetical protein
MKFRKGFQPCVLAGCNGHLEVVKFLVPKGANIRANDDIIFRSGKCNVIDYIRNEEL